MLTIDEKCCCYCQTTISMLGRQFLVYLHNNKKLHPTETFINNMPHKIANSYLPFPILSLVTLLHSLPSSLANFGGGRWPMELCEFVECSVAGNVADPWWCVFSAPPSLPTPPLAALPSEPVVPCPMYHATDYNRWVTKCGARPCHKN